MAFQSIYKVEYIPRDVKPRKKNIPRDAFAEKIDYDIFLNPSVDRSPKSLTREETEKLIKKKYERIYRSQYMWAYCVEAKPPGLKEKSAQEEMMDHFENIFTGSKRDKILPPLPVMRRVQNYAAADAYRTPLTEYQYIYDRVGYDVFRNNDLRIATKLATNGNIPSSMNSLENKGKEELQGENHKEGKSNEEKSEKVYGVYRRATNRPFKCKMEFSF